MHALLLWALGSRTVLSSAAGIGLAPIVVGVVITILGLLAAGWGTFRSQAAQGWRLAAEGYKEQVSELNGRLALAEQLATSLQGRVDQLERRPDLRAVVDAVDGQTKEIIRAVKDEAAQIVAAVKTEGETTRGVIGDVKGDLDAGPERRRR